MLIRFATDTCAVTLALGAPGGALAQATGRFHGTIVDETNATTLPTALIWIDGEPKALF